MTLATPLLIGAAVGGLGWLLKTKDGWTDWWSGWALAVALCFLGESYNLSLVFTGSFEVVSRR